VSIGFEVLARDGAAWAARDGAGWAARDGAGRAAGDGAWRDRRPDGTKLSRQENCTVIRGQKPQFHGILTVAP
jgi:hypothetical protein